MDLANPLALDPQIIIKKIHEFFQDPDYLPDLPHYIVAKWEVVEEAPDFQDGFQVFLSGGYQKEKRDREFALYNTHDMNELRALYKILKNDLKHSKIENVELYQITPIQIIDLIQYAFHSHRPPIDIEKWKNEEVKE